MRSPTEHLTQAARNELVYRDVLHGTAAEHTDWAVTCLFYTMVHRANAYLADLATPPAVESHPDRRKALETTAGHEAARCYHKIYKASVQARYECATFRRNQLREYEKNVLEDFPNYL